MKLVKLTVKRFQCIEAAELEFGPGLNVLYGPNDLGKSSLAWAIRAVLLLQHSSSQHERFVSWYGGGEPRVELTLTDDAGRYWRVSKTFGAGSLGRSALETSKDGRTFTTDASGRQVDEKLRKMLGWGLAGVGGQGAAKGLPDSFLAQVLLAEQDNVRSVLFDTSLTDDPDESGRLRLTAALGALAQDPLFKAVLDDAQDHVDEAFTSTGRKKRSAGSPFVELGEEIKKLRQDRTELDAKLRETGAAEARIREMIARRDTTNRELDEARVGFADARELHALGLQRAALRAQLDAHLATVQAVTTLDATIATSETERDELIADVEPGAARVRDATAELSQAEAQREALAAQLDALVHADAAGEQARGELQGKVAEAEVAVTTAARALEDATEASRRAVELAAELSTGAAAVGTTTTTARAAEAAVVEAGGGVRRATEAAELARQQLRDATSGDRAQALELRKTELANRRLTRDGARGPLETLRRELAELVGLETKIATAETEQARLETEVRATQTAIAGAETRRAELDRNRGLTIAAERYGQLKQARATVAEANQAQLDHARALARAAELAAAEVTLRATVSVALPTSTTIAALRKLREELRIAEALLGGGLSITIRPKRSIELRANRDGVIEPVRTTSDPVILSANRFAAVSIDGLVDVEITAGEAAARTRAAELRARWQVDGASILQAHGAETVEDLETQRVAADAALRQADELRRERERCESAAGEPPADLATITAQITELEAELAGFDADALAKTLAQLGAGGLKTTLATLDRDLDKIVRSLEASRTQLTRSETLRDGAIKTAAELRAELTTRGHAHTEPLAVAQQRCAEALAEVARDVTEIDRQLASLAGGASDEEQVARTRVADAERALALTAMKRDQQQTASNAARDAGTQATTRLETTRLLASQHDRDGVWAAALAAGTPLDPAPWQAALTRAQTRHAGAKALAKQLADELRGLDQARATAVGKAREASQNAEKLARTARTMLDTLSAAHHACEADLATVQVALAKLQAERAVANPEAARAAIEVIRPQLAKMGGGGVVDATMVDTLDGMVSRLEGAVRELDEEVARAQGALEQVGGASVRERQVELDQAIRQKELLEHQIEVEYDAWKLLVEMLRESESTQGAHLGSALAVPISKRFHELTGGRYDALELGAHLEAEGLQVAGESRGISALSAGTQDQLATLLRLCVAEQLHSSIVLDDHLSQSDPDKVEWFNKLLRGAGSQIQIVMITCRPGEVLGAGELAIGDSPIRHVAGGVTSIDLGRVIKRYAPAARSRSAG